MSTAAERDLSEQRVVRAAWYLARSRLKTQPLVPSVAGVCAELFSQGLSVEGERVTELCRALGLDLAGVPAAPGDETREWSQRGGKDEPRR